MKRAEKRYWHLFRCFFIIIQNEWMDLDDQLEKVVDSMAEIRNRLPMESSLIERLNDVAKRKDWACSGNNQFLIGEQLVWGKDNVLFMKEEDIQSAIAHDLLQHEKMMECLRKLFADLSDCHEALSRSLDAVVKHHLTVSEELLLYEGNQEVGSLHVSGTLEKIMDLMNLLDGTFRDLSMELYRKQTLVNIVFESVKDDLFQKNKQTDDAHSDGIGFDWENLAPSEVMHKVRRQWSRKSKWSHMNISQLDRLLELHIIKRGT